MSRPLGTTTRRFLVHACHFRKSINSIRRLYSTSHVSIDGIQLPTLEDLYLKEGDDGEIKHPVRVNWGV